MSIETYNIEAKLQATGTEQFQEAFKQAEKSVVNFNKLGKDITNVGKTMTKWVTGPIAAATVGLFALTNKAANTADKLYEMSAKTGLSAEMLQELDYWGNQNGVSMETMERAAGRLNQRIGLAIHGNEKYSNALRLLGVNMDDVRAGTISTEDAFKTAIGTLAQMENGQEKSALASELLGSKIAQDLMPALIDGAMSIDDAAEAARKFSGFMSNESINTMDNYAQDIADLKVEFEGLGTEVGMSLMPVFRDSLFPLIQDTLIPIFRKLVEGIGDIVDWFNNLSPATQTFIGVLAGVAVAAGPVLTVTGKLVSGFGSLKTAIGKIATEAVASGGGIQGLVSALGGLSTAGMVGIAIAGVAALAAGIYFLVKKITDVPPEVKAMQEAFEKAEKAANEVADSTMAQGKQMDFYMKQIEDLLGIENKSEAQKIRLKAAVDNLNKVVPTLNLLYDEQADTLNRTWQEIETLIGVEKRRIFESAKNKIIEEHIDAQSDALLEVANKTVQLQQLEESRARIEAVNNKLRLTGLTDEQIRLAQVSGAKRQELNLTEEQMNLLTELGEVIEAEKYNIENFAEVSVNSWTTSTHAVNQLDAQIAEATNTLGLLEEGFDKNVVAQDEHNSKLLDTIGQILGLGDTSEEVAATIDQANIDTTYSYDKNTGQWIDMYGNVVEASEEMSSEISGHMSDLTEEQIIELEKQQAAYDTYYKELESRTESIYQKMGTLGDGAVEKTKLTAEEVKENLKQQIADWNTWQIGLAEIQGKVPQVMYDELSKMGPAAQPLLNEYNSMTAEELQEHATLFEEKFGLAREMGISELGPLPEEVGEVVDEANAVLIGKEGDFKDSGAALGHGAVEGYLGTKDKHTSAGSTTGNSFVSGIRSMESAAYNAGYSLGLAANRGQRDALQIKSPSKVARENAENYGKTFIENLLSLKNKALEAGRDFTMFAMQGLERPLQMHVTGSLATASAGAGVSMSSGNIIQNITINSPDPTSPAENARRIKQASRELAMEW